MPFFRIDRTGYQAEGVVAGVVRKGTVGGKLLAVNGILQRFFSRSNTADLSLNVGSKKQAIELCNNWKEKASTLYGEILHVLLK